MTASVTADDSIEVGRYGVRTFWVTRQGIGPITERPLETTWTDGVCVAECQRGDHEAPGAECKCGIYACSDLESLRAQFPVLAKTMIAVIAAEGPTIIGERGFRTSAARIVAYWCHPHYPDAAAIVHRHTGSEAVFFDDLEDMLGAYNIRVMSPPQALLRPSAPVQMLNRFALNFRSLMDSRDFERLLMSLLLVTLVPAAIGLWTPQFGALIALGFTHWGVAASGDSLPPTQVVPTSAFWPVVFGVAAAAITISTLVRTATRKGRLGDSFIKAARLWMLLVAFLGVWGCVHLLTAEHSVPQVTLWGTLCSLVVWFALEFVSNPLFGRHDSHTDTASDSLPPTAR